MKKEEIEKAIKQLKILLDRPNVMISVPKEFEAYLTEEDKKKIKDNHITIRFS